MLVTVRTFCYRGENPRGSAAAMMPQFANPAYLWLMPLVPVLLWWSLRRRHSALRHPTVADLMGLPPGKARLARWGPAVLRALALLLLIVAVAGPRWPDLRTRIETEGIAIVMLVDVSGSMAERDFDWRGEPIARLEAVKKVFHLFVAGGDGPDATGDGSDASSFRGRPTDSIGLVTFATRPETACPLTLSHSVLLRILQAEQPRSIPGESETNISNAVVMGLHRLRGAGSGRKVLVLLSDGEHNVPTPQSTWTPRQAAHVANGLHVPIYTIDAGGSSPSTKEASGVASAPRESPSRGADATPLASRGADATPLAEASPAETRAQAVRTLEEMARIAHGQYFQARDTKGLLSACRAIDELERADVQSFQYRRYHEAYPWFALSAFVLFAAALGLERTIWRRIP